MKRIISATVVDQSGVLGRMTAVLTKRKLNINSLTVAQSVKKDGTANMTIVTEVEDAHQAEQVIKQLTKLIDVIAVADITDQSIVARELVLIKVAADDSTRHAISGLIEPFRASVIDMGHENMTIQVTGNTDKVEALIDLLIPYGIKEMCRTGVAAFFRGSQCLNEAWALSN